MGAPLSLASADRDARAKAVDEAERALQIARRIPFKVLVAHLGLPRCGAERPRQTTAATRRDAASRSCGHRRAARRADRGGSDAERAVAGRARSCISSNDVLDVADVGICLDFGHAHLDGDLVDAIETVSEHLVAVHVHDNNAAQRRSSRAVRRDRSTGRRALTAVQKVGYDGTLMFEIAAEGSTKETLRSAPQGARADGTVAG